jgi:hypothetical protein
MKGSSARRSRSARDPGLADPCFASEEDHLALALLGALPAIQEQAELMLAADERPEPAAAQRLEATLGLALGDHPPGLRRRGDALEVVGAHVLEVEQITEQLPRALRDGHRTGPSQSLETGREIGRLADHDLFLSRTLADQIADHDQAGGDPDPRRERFPGRRDQPTDRGDQLEARTHRPLGVVLMRPWPAEIDEHAVAHVFGDIAVPAMNDLGAATLIGADHLPHVLRVEPSRQRRRADQIDEHHAQLATLGLRSRG